MPNFLELAVELRGECGIPGVGPATVVGQTGELGDVVRWIARAYKHVQNKHRDWEFLRVPFVFQTIATVSIYTPAAISITDHGSWKVNEDWRIYLTSTGTIGEQRLIYSPWEWFREQFLFGATRDQTGPPTDFTIRPDKSIQLFPIPDAIHTVGAWRYKSPDVMVVDTDEPIFPVRFHEILIWQGLTYYGGKEESSSNYARGHDEATRLMGKLELDQLPEPTMAGALA